MSSTCSLPKISLPSKNLTSRAALIPAQDIQSDRLTLTLPKFQFPHLLMSALTTPETISISVLEDDIFYFSLVFETARLASVSLGIQENIR